MVVRVPTVELGLGLLACWRERERGDNENGETEEARLRLELTQLRETSGQNFFQRNYGLFYHC